MNVQPRQQVFAVAIQQRQPVFLGTMQRGMQVVGIERPQQGAKAWRQRHQFHPAQQFGLLQIELRFREPLDRADVIVVRVRDNNVRHILRRHAKPAEQAQRRDPLADAATLRHLRTPPFAHEAGVDEHVDAATLRQHKGEGQVDRALIVDAQQQAGDRLVGGARVLQHVHLPRIAFAG